MRGGASRGLLALSRQHLVDGHEADPQVLGPDLALLRVLALDVVLQARLARKLPLAGDTLVDGRRGLVLLAVATMRLLRGILIISALRLLMLVVIMILGIFLPVFTGGLSGDVQVMSLAVLMLSKVGLRVKKQLAVLLLLQIAAVLKPTVKHVIALILMLSERALGVGRVAAVRALVLCLRREILRLLNHFISKNCSGW